MPGWRVLDLTAFEGSLGIRSNVIYVGDDRIAAIDDCSGILLGPRCRITTSALVRLSEAGVGVCLQDHVGRGYATVVGTPDHDRVAARHRAQAELAGPKAKQAWQVIIKGKIRNQADNLEGHPRQRLRELADGVRSGDAGNSEGHAARIYWDALFKDPHWSRRPRGGDARNSALDYGYGIVRNHMIASTFAAGLWPTLGVHHRHRSNRACLVDDLMEPFRPAVDRLVRDDIDEHLVSEGLDAEAKKALVRVLETELPDGELMRAAIEAWAQQFGAWLDDSSRPLKPPPRVV